MTRTMAIDGPSGSGKSSVADRLAQALNMAHLDTGSMYRAITLDLLEQDIPVEDAEAIRKRLDAVNLTMEPGRVLLNGRDVTKRVREDDVLDGRDIGTVVLPHADLKIFLTPAPEERARRRLYDKKSTSTMDFEQVLADIRRRDAYDSTRAVSPLVQADDAIRIDSTDLEVEDVVERIIKEWHHVFEMH